MLERLQVSLPDRSAAVGLMSGGQRQVIAVARAAAFASKVVILDEPTAALGVRESRRVLDLILRLRAEGHAVIVISHALDHVTEVADRAVVMRRGRKVGEEIPSPDSQERIVALIVGTSAEPADPLTEHGASGDPTTRQTASARPWSTRPGGTCRHHKETEP